MILPLSLLAALPFSAVWAAPMCSLKPPKSASATSSAPAPTASTVGATGSGSNNAEVVATTWYAGWHGTYFPPENLSWSKYSAATYSFALVLFSNFHDLLRLTGDPPSSVTTPDVNTVSLADSDEELLPRFVNLAHQNVSIDTYIPMRSADHFNRMSRPC